MNRSMPFVRAFLIGAVFLTASCNKEDKVPAPVVVENKQAISDPNLFLATSEVSEINFGGIIYKFQYGSNNMIESVEESFTFEEEEEGLIYTFEILSNYDLNYSASRLSSIDVESDVTISMMVDGEKEVLAEESESYDIAVQYNNKNLLQSLTETHTAEDEDYVVKVERTYDSENKLSRENHSEDGEQVQYQTYEWDGFNVTKERVFNEDDGSNERKISARTAFRKKGSALFSFRNAAQARLMSDESTYADYDDKVNPLNVLSIFGFSNGMLISNNNPQRYSFTDSEGTATMVITHEYDSKNRPVKYSATDPVEGPVTIEVKYKN